MEIKKVLITGAGGFIGSHLVEQCLRLGWDVRALVHYNSKNSWGWLDSIKEIRDVEVIAGDIRDFDTVTRIVNGVDTIFHLAALIGIPYSYISPLAYIRTNIEGTYNILEAARHQETPNVLITSTSETYGTAQYIPMDEKHPAVGQSPYSATKIASDQLALSYYRSFGTPVKIVRPFNTYGPRQSARAVIPTTMIQILSGAKKIKLGNVSPTRDLTYVQDTANGFIEIAKSQGLFGEVTNIGSNTEISIGSLVQEIANTMNAAIEIESENERVRPGKSEVERLWCDNTKIRTQTEWRPVFNLKDGLSQTANWFTEHFQTYKSQIYNV